MNMQKFTAIWKDIRHDHVLHGALIVLNALPQSQQVIRWTQSIKQHRDAYVSDHTIGENGNDSDQSLGKDDDALTLISTPSSFNSPIEVKPDDDRKSTIIKRLRSRKAGGAAHRTYRDEESLGEQGHSHLGK